MAPQLRPSQGHLRAPTPSQGPGGLTALWEMGAHVGSHPLYTLLCHQQPQKLSRDISPH